jgi:hypothetical protein
MCCPDANVHALLFLYNTNNPYMNRNIIYVSLLLILVAGGRLPAQNTVNAEMYAEIISALTAQENQPLSFGRFSPEATGGMIQIRPDGVRQLQGAVIPTGTNHTPASFYVTGHLKAQFEVILPEGPVVLYREGGSESMTVRDFEIDSNDGIWILDDGTKVVNLGATLEVGSLEENPTGMYSGTYSIIFLYY